MKSWLDQVVEYSKHSESPERYYWWCGLAVLSAIVKKNVNLERHYYKLYANVYVVIVSARSGLRKGVPISLVNYLLDKVGGVRVVGGQNSIQAVIKELSKQVTLEDGTVFSNAQAILVSDEFDAFLLDDSSALTTLTALHNTHEHAKFWKKSLKGGEPEVLKEPCISLIAASNETLFNDIVKSKDIEGGFLARTFIVYESKRRSVNSLVTKPPVTIEKRELTPYLIELAKVKGEFKWTPKSGALYEKWYQDLCRIDIADRTGSIDRLGDQVLKVAMLVSLSKDFNLELKVQDLDEAISKSEECILGTNKVALGNGNSEFADGTAKILKILLESPGQEVSRKVLLNKIMHDVDAITLDRIVDTLTQSRAIEDPFTREGNGGRRDLIYKMTKETHDKYKTFQRVN